MMAFMCLKSNTQPNCIEVSKTLYVCMGVVYILSVYTSVCIGVVETPPDHNRVSWTLTLVKKKRNDIIAMSEK